MINGNSEPYSAPALVLGSGMTVLATIRCLGVSDIPVYCIDINQPVNYLLPALVWNPVAVVRYCAVDDLGARYYLHVGV